MNEILKQRKAELRENARIAGAQVSNELHLLTVSNADLVIDPPFISNKKVLKINESTDCTFHILDTNKLTKLFINSCENCTVNVESKLLTQHLEVSHCEQCVFNLGNTSQCLTVSVDLCKDIVLSFGENLFNEHTKIIHAGVSDMKIRTFEGQVHEVNYLDYDFGAESEEHGHMAKEEMQFLTSLVDGELQTCRVEKKQGHLLPTNL